MQIDCIDHVEDATYLVPEWLALWQRCWTTPFQSPHWLLPWWRIFANDLPQLITAREGGALVGILPLYVRPEADRVKLLPLGIGLSDYIDALTLSGRSDIAAALLGAAAELPQWQECHLPDLPPDAALLSTACPPACEEERVATVPCPVLMLPPSIDALDSVVPHKTLRDVRQARHRSTAVGEVTIERVGNDELDGAMADLFRLHGERWQNRGESGVFASSEVRQFHRNAARAMGSAGLLRLYRLRIGGAVAAVYYGFLHQQRAYAYLGGFDPELRRLSPGAQIIAHAIGDAIAEGVAEFHFLRGSEAYKYAWGAVDRWNTARTFRR